MSKLGDTISSEDMMRAKTAICDVFENILDEHDITIPDDDREDYGNKEEQARLFGSSYYKTEDAVEEILDNIEIKKEPCLDVNKLLDDTKDCRKIKSKKPKDITDLLGRFNIISNLLNDSFCRANIYKFKDTEMKNLIQITENYNAYDYIDTPYSEMGILRILVLNDMGEEEFDDWMNTFDEIDRPDILKLSEYENENMIPEFPYYVAFGLNSMDEIYDSIKEVHYGFDYIYLIMDIMKKENFDYEKLKVDLNNSSMTLILNDTDMEIEPTMQATMFNHEVDIVEL